MSKKLEKQIASGNIVVKNTKTGEIAISVAGKNYQLGYGETLDLGKILQDAGLPFTAALNIPNLKVNLAKGWLVLV